MISSLFIAPIPTAPICNSLHCSKIHTNTFRIVNPTLNLPLSSPNLRFSSVQISRSHSNSSPSDGEEDEEEDQEGLVRDLRVPENWGLPSKALEESEWLRVNLHKWLDDEYCPEATNVEISTVAAQSYYQSLVQKQTDLGEILLRMAGELESISYQESFHGAFSSANAAVSLIIQRIEQD
ncbi:Titin like [Actinidia chinensis var. chinensis]|uniref:Titin like n=1 Tax=Actinidia chinensis var. chinensis TaxID=1590841 RepID=A0A2R6QE67_ACTCC|nr:Titin like [Actinidia chinensis var. chinensis]